ncbi:MAG: VWA domain-containing protein [Rikenellaceae bacterium]
MFRFAEPLYLYLLFLIPLLIVVFILFRRSQKRRLSQFGDLSFIGVLMPEASPRRVKYKFILLLCVVLLLSFALAQPQVGSKLKEVRREGVEIILAVDVSNSMLAEDFTPNRLERTKNAVGQLVEKLDRDRVGMVVFAGNAYVQLPVTSDYVSAKSFIRSLSPTMVPEQGTSVSKAIELSTRSFSEQSTRSRAVILITDGESHDDDPLAAAQAAKDAGVVIYTVGIGTPEGSPIEIDGQMIRDEEDQIVVSKLDEETLQQIAVLTGGAYVRASERNVGLDLILSEIDKMQKQEFSSMVFEEYADQFHYLTFIALLLLLAEFVMIDRRNRIFAKIKVFK